MLSVTRAVNLAGASVAEVNEPEWFRVLNVSSRIVHVTTTLPEDISMPAGPKVEFDLEEGGYRDLSALPALQIRGDAPIAVGQLQGSQSTTGIPFTLPGGDPAGDPGAVVNEPQRAQGLHEPQPGRLEVAHLLVGVHLSLIHISEPTRPY